MPDQSRYCNHELIDFIIKNGKRMTFRTHECAVNLGEKSDKVFLILKGGFVCQQYNLKTERFRTINFYLQRFHPMMTVLSSYFGDSSSQCQLKAVMKSEVMMVKKKAIMDALEADSILKEAYTREREYIILTLHEFHTKQVTLSSKDLFQYLLEDCNEVVRQVPAKYIAEFMGVSAEWLSKIR
ncbi:MAG: hypothetical protein AAGC43_13080 [Bacteroidota bacterium]